MADKANKNYAIGVVYSANGKSVPFVQVRGKVGREFGNNNGFSDSRDAHVAAAEHLIRILNARTKDKRKRGYMRMTGGELSHRISEIGITLSEFAMIEGTTLDRVTSWVHGVEDIPHHATVITDLLRLPGALEVARESTSRSIDAAKKETGNAS